MTRILTDGEKEFILKAYQTGNYTTTSIEKEIGRGRHAISRFLKQNNIHVKSAQFVKQFNVNENYFDVIDSEIKAYFLGFLYADGCNYTPRHQVIIHLAEEDREILEIFKKELNYGGVLGFVKKTNPNRKNGCRICIGNKHLSEKLSELGCIHKKSLILNFPIEKQVPFCFIRHFIRGYFDGDGHFGTFMASDVKKGKRCKPYKRCNFSICSTENFNLKLKEIIKQELNVNSLVIVPNKKVFNSTRNLFVSGRHQIFKVLDWIYEDATIFLKRKYEKYLLEKEYFKNKDEGKI